MRAKPLSNQPFVLISGLNATTAVFAELAQALWPLGPVTLANQVEGEGVGGIAAHILKAAPPQFALLGFSMGGYISLEIMRQAPERVRKLCLLDTTARPDAPEASAKRRERMALAEAGQFARTVEEGFEMTVHPNHLGREDLQRLTREMAMAMGPETFIRHQRAIIERPDSRPTLPGIRVPTAVITGEADRITPPEAAREMAAAIAGAKLTLIPGAGHMAIIEQPEATIAAIVAWARG